MSNWDDLALSVSHAAATGEPRTVCDLLDFGEHVLQGSGHIDAEHDHRQDAYVLLRSALGDAPSPQNEAPPKRVRDRYLALIARRAGGEPVPQLTGWVDFAGLKLEVRRDTFVPRPSSEWTVEHLVARLANMTSPLVVDLCTGIGPIALALAAKLPHARVWGTDISAPACTQARKNAQRLQLDNVSFRNGSAYDPLPRTLRSRVSAIVGYIPYLSNEDIRGLHTEVASYEPLHTLTDLSADGFDLLRHILDSAPIWLSRGGLMLIQIDADTAPRLEHLFDDAGFTQVQISRHQEYTDVLIEGRTPV